METLIFAMSGNENLADKIGQHLKLEKGESTIRQFPDEETYVRIVSEVKGKNLIVVCTLDHPDNKFLPLYFFCKTARDLGAKHIAIMAPYLAYMRQDIRFNPGEAVTSDYFGELISGFADGLVTMDPHLHRKHSLREVYGISSTVVHAAISISMWIKENVKKPVLVGPDEESEQWVSEVAEKAGAPFIILTKKRHGDTDVEISVPQMKRYKDHTPVLVDDIISTARTMMGTVKHLLNSGMAAPICIGVHPIFAGQAYQDLKEAGAARVLSCNTIPHESNVIDISEVLSAGYTQLMKG